MDEVSSGPSVQSESGHPDRCSCPACARAAMRRFALTHCEEGEEVHQYIVRHAMTATKNPIQRVAEATLLWNQYMAYIRRLCPEAVIAPIPGWFSWLLKDDPHYPDGYNPGLVDKTYAFWMADRNQDDDLWDDPGCECDDCGDDHDRDETGNCLCPRLLPLRRRPLTADNPKTEYLRASSCPSWIEPVALTPRTW